MANSSNPCTHTETNSIPNCAVCSKLKVLNGNIVEAFEKRSTFLEEVNRDCDPIQRLPVEVTSSIFALCLPGLPLLDIFDGTPPKRVKKHMARQAVQFHLGSVCRHWRRIVWSTPHFWNTLWLQLSDRTSVTCSQMVADWLRRSGQLPLNISVFFLHNEDSDSDESDSSNESVSNTGHGGKPMHSVPTTESDRPTPVSVTNDIIDTLCHYIDRMKVLQLSQPGPLLQRFRNDSDGNPIHRTNNRILEKLFVYLPEDSESSYRFDLGGVDPSPTHVSFNGINYRAISIHWDNVTSLETSELFNYDALQILQLAPKLEVFKVSILYPTRLPAELPRVTHHSLRILCLTESDTNKFLDFITCPVLNKLSYHPALTSRTSLSLTNFLRRSACVLKDLSIESREHTRHLLSVLWLTPSLTHLSLGKSGIPNKLLPSLANTEFLPHLSTFSTTAIFTTVRWSNILSLVTSQLTTATPPMQTNFRRPLSRITVNTDESFSQYIDHATLIQIIQLIRDGIEVEITGRAGFDLISRSKAHYGLQDSV